jgi:23S rRNA (guanosine2251-2'-O)-methyltransferase
VDRILVAREGGGARIGQLLRLARNAGVAVTHLPREVLTRKVGRATGHQGVAALVSAVPYADVQELCETAAARSDGLLVLLDQVADPGNLGAVVRTAAGAGADGVILTREGTVGLSPAVAKSSAGALERIAVARERRPGRRLQALRQRGFSVIGLDPRAARPWDSLNLRGRVVLVAGGEERGIRQSLREACDSCVAVPLAAGVESLNVAVALGIVLFEVVRQRRPRPGEPPAARRA